jgi:hypothetical protein
MSPEVLAVVLGALLGGSGIAGVLTVVFSRRKIKAEGDTFITDAAGSLVGTALKQLGRLEKEVAGLARDIDNYRVQLEAAVIRETELTVQIKSLQRRVQVLEDFITAHGLVVPKLQPEAG